MAGNTAGASSSRWYRPIPGFHPHQPAFKHRWGAKLLGATMWFWIFYRAKQDGAVLLVSAFTLSSASASMVHLEKRCIDREETMMRSTDGLGKAKLARREVAQCSLGLHDTEASALPIGETEGDTDASHTRSNIQGPLTDTASLLENTGLETPLGRPPRTRRRAPRRAPLNRLLSTQSDTLPILAPLDCLQRCAILQWF